MNLPQIPGQAIHFLEIETLLIEKTQHEEMLLSLSVLHAGGATFRTRGDDTILGA